MNFNLKTLAKKLEKSSLKVKREFIKKNKYFFGNPLRKSFKDNLKAQKDIHNKDFVPRKKNKVDAFLSGKKKDYLKNLKMDA